MAPFHFLKGNTSLEELDNHKDYHHTIFLVTTSALIKFYTNDTSRKENHVAKQTKIFTNLYVNCGHYLTLINRGGGLYGRILTEVVSTDRMQ